MSMKLIALMIFLQCFVYKNTDFGPVLELGFTVSPDRLVFIIILTFAIWKFTCGELQFHGLGRVERYMLLFAIICTMSSFVMGTGSRVFFSLFDFNYNPLTVFILAKSIPHGRKKLESLSFAFLAVGAYLATNISESKLMPAVNVMRRLRLCFEYFTKNLYAIVRPEHAQPLTPGPKV